MATWARAWTPVSVRPEPWGRTVSPVMRGWLRRAFPGRWEGWAGSASREGGAVVGEDGLPEGHRMLLDGNTVSAKRWLGIAERWYTLQSSDHVNVPS